MKPNHKLLMGLGAVAILAGGATAIPRTFAATDTSTSPIQSLVDKIATKFNLNKSDVQAVFDENKTEMEAKHAENFKTRLDQAVKDGKLTQAQEDLIVAKQAEEQTFRDSLKDKTPEERRTAMQQHMTDLQKWATDNTIPKQYLPFGPGKAGRGGHGGFEHGMRGEAKDAAPTGTTTSN